MIEWIELKIKKETCKKCSRVIHHLWLINGVCFDCEIKYSFMIPKKLLNHE